MTMKLHTILSFTLLSTINFLVYFKPSQLIGFLHGPKSQIEAVQAWDALHETNSKNVATSWINYFFCNTPNESYQRASSFHDAGVIASLFIIITILFPNFIPLNLSKNQRLHSVLAVPSIWITPGLFGQILSKTIPVELSSSSRGIAVLSNAVYCSLESVMSGPSEQSLMNHVMYEVKVLLMAAILLFLFWGIIPLRKKKEMEVEV